MGDDGLDGAVEAVSLLAAVAEDPPVLRAGEGVPRPFVRPLPLLIGSRLVARHERVNEHSPARPGGHAQPRTSAFPLLP